MPTTGLFYTKNQAWPTSDSKGCAINPQTPSKLIPPYKIQGENVRRDDDIIGSISQNPIGEQPFCMLLSSDPSGAREGPLAPVTSPTLSISSYYMTLAHTIQLISSNQAWSNLDPNTRQPIAYVVVGQPVWGGPLPQKPLKNLADEKSSNESKTNAPTLPTPRTLKKLNIAIVKLDDFKKFWKRTSPVEYLLTHLIPIAVLITIAGSFTYAYQAAIASSILSALLCFIMVLITFYYRENGAKIMLDSWTIDERFPDTKHLTNRRPFYLFLACLVIWSVLGFLADLSILGIIPTPYFVNPFVSILYLALSFIVISLIIPKGYELWSQKLSRSNPTSDKTLDEIKAKRREDDLATLTDSQDAIASSIIAKQIKQDDPGITFGGRTVARTMEYSPETMVCGLNIGEPSSPPPPLPTH